MWASTTVLAAATLIFSFLQISNSIPGNQVQAVQTSSTSGGKPKDSNTAAPDLGPAQTVITVRGLCSPNKQKNASDTGCTRVITKDQFENLINALNPQGQPVSPRARQNLAKSYAEFVAFEAAARKAGVENTPKFQQVMDWVRLRTIADFYRRDLQEKYDHPSKEEIDAYYRQHLPDFDRVKLIRILVPRDDASAPDKKAFEQKALQAATAARDRAAKGEDPAQIQKDVYSTLGLGSPPPTELGNYGRANFVEKEGAEVFALKPGEVSQVQIEPKSYVIYKVTERKTLTEDEVNKDISRTISEQKFKDAVKAIMDSAPPEFNEQYFGPGMVLPENVPAKPATPPAH